MILHFPDHLVAAVRGEDLLLLDLRLGEYACAPGVAAALELEPVHQRVVTADPETAEMLSEAGLLRTGPGSRRPIPFPPPPRRDLPIARVRTRWPARWGRVAAAAFDLTRSYWGADLPAILARAQGRRTGHLRDAPDDLLAAVTAAFSDALPWIPFQGDCLFRAVLLQAMLRRRGLRSSLVIGAQTWPFEAHAWVQCGDLVLGDGVDHVIGFSPILAV